MKGNSEKFQIVNKYNTFYFHDATFEEEWESYISSMVQTLLLLKNDIESKGLSEKLIAKYLQTENGLDCILALLGISQERFMRLITFLLTIDDKEANDLINRKNWKNLERSGVEIKLKMLKSEIRKNSKLALGVAKLFMKGATLPVIINALPLSEVKKFDISKLSFKTEALLDTIIRYKLKGQYSASVKNNPENLICKLLERNGIAFERGKIKNIRRNLDFIIPDKQKPLIIIESSYEVTTSSAMGDKAKTEIEVRNDIKKNYPGTYFIGFVDGIGWYVRKSDLQKMVQAFDDVFTFHKIQIQRFEKFIKEVFGK